MNDDFPTSRLQMLAVAVVAIPIYAISGVMMLVLGPKRWRRVAEKIEAMGGSTD